MRSKSLAILALASACGFAAALATASETSCTRPVEATDIGFELKGDTAHIVIENKTTACGIVFLMSPRSPTGLPLPSGIWIRGMNGESLSKIEAGGPEAAWYPIDIQSRPRPKKPWRFVLARGDRHVIAIDLLAIMREVSRERLAANLTDLPWGTTVEVMLDAVVLLPHGVLSSSSDEFLPKVHKVSQPFSYRLPPN
jgi:hypothetical protein